MYILSNRIMKFARFTKLKVVPVAMATVCWSYELLLLELLHSYYYYYYYYY